MADNSDPVFELVDGQALDALEDGSAVMAITGLKNELNRLHELYKMGWYHGAADDVWTRIIVIQEALLDVARMLVRKG